MQGNEKKTNTQRQKEGHVEQLASTRILDGESAAPLSVCVLYIVQQRQGYHMQLNNEVGLLHTERVYGKEMDQGDRFS